MVEFRKSFYVTNGIILHTAEAGNPEGRTLLFLHGFPEFWYSWIKQLALFADHGWHVVAPDQRGYHLSSKPAEVKDYAVQELTQDIAEIIPQVSKDKVVLVGHDWGGGVAWNLALQNPHLLEKLVILNMPHPQVIQEHLSSNPRQLFRSWHTGFFQLPWLPEKVSSLSNYKLLENSLKGSALPGTFQELEIAAYKTAWGKPGALKAMINWYRTYKYKPICSYHKIEVPTLLVWGKKDRFLASEMAQPSIEQCLNGRLVFLENATHWLHHEHPEQVNALLLKFVQQ